ncbi:NUDIX hydrolase [Antrihabitans cavernicola]|uniref:CoA pyrophosphatase n=1 Tax=Antrihabitans cavernicola TaxID=2495913 RepID=A0A5A7S9F8_9NOCA|nr:CoA pyrophosphatase [Spelaeibacter cavernicola]KAA0020072.1 CoA pyrophosphatase [Spelaeibacter cavernicola]
MTAPDEYEITPETLRVALSEFRPRTADLDGRRSAAVVVAVGVTDDGDAGFLLTMRPDRMRAHPGQFALPGGGVDPGETLQVAALRELHEELGIAADDSQVLGRLDDYVTRSGYVISPFVVWVGTDLTRFVANPDEVATVFVPSMAELDTEPRFVRIPESDRPIVQWPFRGFLVHAPTGAVIYQFREIALHGRHTRTDQLDQPVFAWR